MMRRTGTRIAAWRACVCVGWWFAAHAAWADNGVPTPAKLVIVVEENHAYSQIIGAASAPYINALAAGGALFTQSYGTTHPSQPNYLALFAGSTLGVTTNNVYPHSQFTAPNLGAKLLASSRGYTFGGYSETMPSVGYDGATFGVAPATYQRKHNPWVNWQDATVPLPPNKLPPSVNMPFDGYFPADYAALPTVSIVVPNQLHDMHDGTVAQGDAWLQANLAGYTAWCRTHNGLLIVTFDEDDSSDNNRVATIFYGPMVAPGQYGETVTHARLLRTIEDMFGLPYSAGTLTTTPIVDVWMPCVPTVTQQPVGLRTCPAGTVSCSVGAQSESPISGQWQWRRLGGQTWQDVLAGTNTDGVAYFRAVTGLGLSVEVSDYAEGGIDTGLRVLGRLQLRCVLTNPCGSVTTEAALATFCPQDYNCDSSVNPDDLGDFITDYYTAPPLPGPGGFSVPCPNNPPPYDAGYRAGYTMDGAGQCSPPFPDNLGDFITAYFGPDAAC